MSPRATRADTGASQYAQGTLHYPNAAMCVTMFQVGPEIGLLPQRSTETLAGNDRAGAHITADGMFTIAAAVLINVLTRRRLW